LLIERLWERFEPTRRPEVFFLGKDTYLLKSACGIIE